MCPFCKQRGPFIKKGFSGRKQRYQCKCCGKKFTYDAMQLTYWSHQTPDKWATLIEDTISLQPLTKVEEDLEVSHPTAQNMRHKLRVFLKVYHLNTINGLHSQFKEMLRTYRGVASKYLNRYAAMFSTIASLVDSSIAEADAKIRKMLKNVMAFATINAMKTNFLTLV